MSLAQRLEGSSLGGPLSSSRSPRHPITFDHASRDFTSCGPYAPAAFRAGGFFVVRATWSCPRMLRHSADIGWPSSSRRYQS